MIVSELKEKLLDNDYVAIRKFRDGTKAMLTRIVAEKNSYKFYAGKNTFYIVNKNNLNEFMDGITVYKKYNK